MNEMIYIVTGAAGFLGGTVCRQLIERGDRVRAFVLPNDPAAKYVPEGAEVIYGDLRDMESLEKLFTVPEGTKSIVLHIASIVTVDPGYDQKVIDVNVGGTKNIIDMCLAHPECEKLVYCSSTGAIPEAPKGRRISEVYFFDEDKVEGCYSMSKALATQAVLDAVRERELNACVVHPSGIMGPEDLAVGETTGTLIKIIGGEMPIGINGTFDLCDVRDLAAGTIAAADKGRQGECYILGNDAISFKDFCRLVSEEAQCKAPKAFLPIAAAYLIARLSEMSAKKKGKKPLMTTFSVYNLARNNEFDSSKAKRELGYQTRSYKETIHDEIVWLKASGKIA
ncbi:MAG: NAD-dependent epimerase/dehydratase family protein [Ruminococcus sp.]|nr:NAD-dependent epimerase/dehydratase family protein [Ruminococcus sp.]